MRPVLPQRFWDRVERSGEPGECWLWTGTTMMNGYGEMRLDGTRWYVHRLAYEALVGPIPEGLHIDHLCRVRNCVNPDHLEPVTPEENVRRGVPYNAKKTHCPRQHPYDRINKRGARVCGKCQDRQKRESLIRCRNKDMELN